MIRTRTKSKSPAREPTYIGQYLMMHPRVCHGQLTFRGTRVPVKTVLERLAVGRTIESLRKSWPEVSGPAIAEAVTLATDLLLEHARSLHEPIDIG